MSLNTAGPRPPRTYDIKEISDTTATLSWTPPLTGQPDDYLITLQNNNNKRLTTYPALAYPATEFVLWHLENNTPYTAFLQTRIDEERSTNMSMGFRTGL